MGWLGPYWCDWPMGFQWHLQYQDLFHTACQSDMVVQALGNSNNQIGIALRHQYLEYTTHFCLISLLHSHLVLEKHNNLWRHDNIDGLGQLNMHL
jgi:hypothetical protein